MKICVLCFTLIEKENELMSIEKALVEMQGLSIKAISLGPVKIERPVLLEPNLHQYRLMFFIEKIEGNIELLRPNKQTNTSIEIQLFDQPCTFILPFTKKVRSSPAISAASSPASKSYLMANRIVDVEFSTVMILKKLRFHYLYSITTDISRFLNQANLEVSLIQEGSTNPRKVIGRSLLQALANFTLCEKADMIRPGFATRHTSTIKIFNRDLNSSYDVTVIVGISYDGTRNTKDINLYKYDDFPVYYPNIDYFTSDLLPSEWMEIFTSQNLPSKAEESSIRCYHYEPCLAITDANKKTVNKKPVLPKYNTMFNNFKVVPLNAKPKELIKRAELYSVDDLMRSFNGIKEIDVKSQRNLLLGEIKLYKHSAMKKSKKHKKVVIDSPSSTGIISLMSSVCHSAMSKEAASSFALLKL